MRRNYKENGDGHHHHITPTTAVSNCSQDANREHDGTDKMTTNDGEVRRRKNNEEWGDDEGTNRPFLTFFTRVVVLLVSWPLCCTKNRGADFTYDALLPCVCIGGG
jgi:hypothetical protein